MLLHKAAADPKAQIAIKRDRAGTWCQDHDHLEALADGGHLDALGESMGPHIGGTFAVWRLTPEGRALAESVPLSNKRSLDVPLR